MKKAKQHEINAFMDYAFNDISIWPYLTHSAYTPERVESKDDWSGLTLTDENVSYLLEFTFKRDGKHLEMIFALFAKTPIAAGRGIKALMEMIGRYRPFAISSSVAVSNSKSMAATKRFLGDPWGLEPKSHYNWLTGEMEDTACFKKIL